MIKNQGILIFKLLPNKFKKFVYVLLLIPITFGILKSAHFLKLEDFIFKRTFTILLFIPLILLVFTSEKVEDERVQKIRLNALAFAAVSGFVYLVGDNIIDLAMSNNNADEISGREITLYMIIMYLGMKFYMLRKS